VKEFPGVPATPFVHVSPGRVVSHDILNSLSQKCFTATLNTLPFEILVVKK
jgi:hypothetical protein